MLRVYVQEKIDERPFELCPQAPIQRESRSGQLDRPFEIQDAELRPKVPVCLRLKVELRRSPVAPDLDVIVLRPAYGHALMRHVGKPYKEFLKLLVDGLHLLVQVRDLVAKRTNGLLQFGSVRAVALQLSDLRALGVLVRLELFGLGDGRAALFVELAKTVEGEVAAARGEPFGDMVEVGAYESEIEHSLC